MINYNYALYLGLNDKDTKKQKYTINQARTILSDYLLNQAGVQGATIEAAKGIYTHEDGATVCENTFKIILCYINHEKMVQIVDDLKKLFNQESIMIERLSNIIFI